MMAVVFPQQPAPDMNAEVLMLLREIRDELRAMLLPDATKAQETYSALALSPRPLIDGQQPKDKKLSGSASASAGAHPPRPGALRWMETMA